VEGVYYTIKQSGDTMKNKVFQGAYETACSIACSDRNGDVRFIRVNPSVVLYLKSLGIQSRQTFLFSFAPFAGATEIKFQFAERGSIPNEARTDGFYSLPLRPAMYSVTDGWREELNYENASIWLCDLHMRTVYGITGKNFSIWIKA
jgi:hypothetical protein